MQSTKGAGRGFCGRFTPGRAALRSSASAIRPIPLPSSSATPENPSAQDSQIQRSPRASHLFQRGTGSELLRTPESFTQRAIDESRQSIALQNATFPPLPPPTTQTTDPPPSSTSSDPADVSRLFAKVSIELVDPSQPGQTPLIAQLPVEVVAQSQEELISQIRSSFGQRDSAPPLPGCSPRAGTGQCAPLNFQRRYATRASAQIGNSVVIQSPVGACVPCPGIRREISCITMKRKNIALKGDDKYGHWWVEIDGTESYGWWPQYPVTPIDTLQGVKGELNGTVSFQGSRNEDPHHGDTADEEFHPYVDCCDRRTDEEIKKCLRKFATSYSGEWRWTFGSGQNCHTFQEEAMKHCGLQKP